MSYRFEDSFQAVPSWSCLKAVFKPVWHIPVPSVQWINSWWWAEELPETCRVSCQSKFGKLLHLVGFIVKNCLQPFTQRCSVTCQKTKSPSSVPVKNNTKRFIFCSIAGKCTVPKVIWDLWTERREYVFWLMFVKKNLQMHFVYFLLGISPASNCSWLTFRNPVSVPSSKAGCTVWGVRGSKVFYTPY